LETPETFNFLGFTFISGKSRRGSFLVKRKSRRDRMLAKLQAIKQELRQRMHQPTRPPIASVRRLTGVTRTT
jgi:RNA-directed DNA polymerase